MPTQTPPNPPNPSRDPKADPARERDRGDPSRRSSGPNNPLPGEPGGPSTSGHVEAEEHDDKARDRDPKDQAKR